MVGEVIEVGNYVAVNGPQRLRILRVCKLTPKMIVVEYFTAVRRARRTMHLYANDVIKVKGEGVLHLALSN